MTGLLFRRYPGINPATASLFNCGKGEQIEAWEEKSPLLSQQAPPGRGPGRFSPVVG
jgi:hypothetical protein